MSSSNKEQPVKEDIFFFLVSTRCLIWPRVVLDFLFIKDPHLAKVMSTLISRDITHKVARHFNPDLLTQASTPDFQTQSSWLKSLGLRIRENFVMKKSWVAKVCSLSPGLKRSGAKLFCQ